MEESQQNLESSQQATEPQQDESSDPNADGENKSKEEISSVGTLSFISCAMGSEVTAPDSPTEKESEGLFFLLFLFSFRYFYWLCIICRALNVFCVLIKYKFQI